jgi:hypothetical protein
MRRIILLGLTLASFVGCSLEDALENAPCESEDDCAGSQACVQTEHQANTGQLGWCRSDGSCAAGEQEGCLAGSGCSSGSPVTGGSGASYCCPYAVSGEVIVIEAADQSSAWCLTTDEIVTCDDDTECPVNISCVRTLEQQAEDAQELEPADQPAEPGWCLPGGCLGGSQEGCSISTGESCGSGLTSACAGSRCYCCETPVSSGYTARVYAETELGESAACVACPDCPNYDPCTELEDPACILMDGACGCLTAA